MFGLTATRLVFRRLRDDRFVLLSLSSFSISVSDNVLGGIILLLIYSWSVLRVFLHLPLTAPAKAELRRVCFSLFPPLWLPVVSLTRHPTSLSFMDSRMLIDFRFVPPE